jgi:hypothetical protein
MKTKKTLGRNIARKKSASNISDKLGIKECRIEEGMSGLLHMHFSQAAFDAVKQCFIAYGVTNSQVYCDDGEHLVIPIVDLSEVWITPTAHQFFALGNSSEHMFFITLVAIRVHHTTRNGRWLSGSEEIKGLKKVARKFQHLPIKAFSGLYQIDGQDVPGIRTVICAPEFDELPDVQADL